MSEKIKYISVCSGIEAASVAWHDMGWEPVAFSEIEPFPSEVLKIRFPNTPNWGDMTKFNTWPDANVNLLVGGTPCQSFSVAGLRQGLKDPRGNLMLTFLAIAERYKPKWIVWENVPGVLSSNGGKDFGSFLGALGELGYGWAYRVLDAQWFGVAQRRKRVFVVGCLGDQRAAAEVLFESESVSRNPAPSREKRQAVTRTTEESVGGGKWWDGGDTSATLTTRSGGQYMPDKDNFQAVIQVAGFLPTQGSKAKGIGYKEEQAPTLRAGCDTYGVLQPTIIDRAAFNQGENAQYEPRIEESETMPSLVARGPHAVAQPIVLNDQGGSFMDVTKDGLSPTLRAQTHRHEPTVLQPIAVDTYNYTTNDQTTQTIRAQNDTEHIGAVMNPPMAIRRLTPVECERLQGFPDNWTQIPWKKKPAEDCPDGPRYKACGNSMAVPCMKWLGQRIQKTQDKIEGGKNN
jgi:DNA (cytosine-5)-methyltransferase 1